MCIKLLLKNHSIFYSNYIYKIVFLKKKYKNEFISTRLDFEIRIG